MIATILSMFRPGPSAAILGRTSPLPLTMLEASLTGFTTSSAVLNTMEIKTSAAVAGPSTLTEAGLERAVLLRSGENHVRHPGAVR